MNLVIDLPRPVEDRIEQEAQKVGISPAEFVAQVVQKNFAATLDTEEQKRLNTPSITLVQSWLAKANDARTDDDLAAAEQEMNTLMRSLNATRREAGERLHFPDIEEEQ